MARIQLLSVDSSLADRLSEAMGDRVPVSMVQSLDDAGIEKPGIVVMDHAAMSAGRSLTSSITAIAEQANGRQIILATDDLETDVILQAMRAGAADVIPRNATGEEVSRVLSRHLNNVVATQGLPARLTLVLGMDREASAILATDLALAHAYDRNPGLLIDCTLPNSAAESYLDISVDYGLASAVADIGRLDSSLLSDALARHDASGLSLLTLDGGTGSEPTGIEPSDIVKLTQLMRSSYDNVVFCAGNLRHSGLLRELASQAQSIEVVCRQSLRELGASRQMLEQIGADPATLSRMRLLVWDHEPGILLDGRRMADALQLENVLNVPVDRVSCANAFNAGQPLMQEGQNTPYSRAIARIGNITVQEKRTLAGFNTLRRSLLRTVERSS